MLKIINRTEETVHIDNIKPHPANPNDGDVAAIAESIRQNGFYGRVVVRDSTGKILAVILERCSEAGMECELITQ